ncbi:hypothetical protein [Altibacter sp. HG106]|uniref:hypothetical protein n=1 Tax=Altibacter sp. HG106 TaxID=3023937 RepID=UPI00234FE1F6|nr:hypothetical protein [Altibacter sp. HG106]MDC7995737.1 hypothetical protein [Altibacter sp. HG106]
MEKPSNEKDPFLRKQLQEVPLERVSNQFSENIMRRLQPQPLSKTPPLISNTVLWCIGSGFLGASLLLWGWPNLTFFNSEVRSIIATWKWNPAIELPNLSQHAMYAVAFLSLFLLQIPFLIKQRISKE